MEIHVISGAHCLLLRLDPVMGNLACSMVWIGCLQRSNQAFFSFFFDFSHPNFFFCKQVIDYSLQISFSINSQKHSLILLIPSLYSKILFVT